MSEPSVPRARSRQELASLAGGLATALIAVIIIAALHFGRDIFIPLALSVLLSFALAPACGKLQRLRVPRSLAVVTVVLLAFAAMLGMGALLAKQVADLADELPRYERNIREKIQSLRGAADGNSTLERASAMIEGLSDEIDGKEGEGATSPPVAAAAPTPGAGGGSGSAEAPEEPLLQVEIHEPEPGALERLGNLVSPLVDPILTGFIILIFVIFILLQREDLRNRLIRLAGSRDIPRTTAALDDAASRIAHLFLLQFLVNAAFGVVIGLGLWAIGVPNALLWGFLGMVTRFLPFIGFILAAVIPVILAFAIDPGWELLLWTVGLFLVVETLIGQVIEPLVYGRSTGLSPVAVVVSATFWTALWGLVGLLLATPITVCLVVLGRHVERLRFLDILFGDQPVLSPPQLFYQRVLAGDPMEAAAEAEPKLKEKPLAVYYEEVAVAGLLLAQGDLKRGALDEARLLAIRDTVKELATDLLDQEALVLADAGSGEAMVPGALPLMPLDAAPAGGQVLCIGGRSALDEATAILLGQVLKRQGLAAQVRGPETLSIAGVGELALQGAPTLCLCYLDIDRPAHLRFTVRRLRRRLPRATILLGCWSAEAAPLKLADLQALSGADAVFGSLHDLARRALEAAGAVVPAVAPPAPADSPLLPGIAVAPTLA